MVVYPWTTFRAPRPAAATLRLLPKETRVLKSKFSHSLVFQTNAHIQQHGAPVNRDGEADHEEGKEELKRVVGEGMTFQEDNYLTSANMCRWVIDYNELTIGSQVCSPLANPLTDFTIR